MAPLYKDIDPRGSIYTTIKELGPKIPYHGRNYGSQFPNGCICGPSGDPYLPIISVFLGSEIGPVQNRTEWMDQGAGLFPWVPSFRGLGFRV